MTTDISSSSTNDDSDSPDEALGGWLRWWHWLVVTGLLIAIFLYYPLWRFEQNWNKIQIGDSLDHAFQLLGDPGEASYSVGPSEAFVYTRYWITFELTVSQDGRRVSGKTVIGSGAATPTAQPAKK